MEEKNTQSSMFKNANYRLFRFAKSNRENQTKAEEALWNELKNKQLEGFKFRRQHPLGSFILDFYCHANRLGIELDGEYHQGIVQQQYDEFRTESIETLTDISIIRFTNEEVLTDIENVKMKIVEHLKRNNI